LKLAKTGKGSFSAAVAEVDVNQRKSGAAQPRALRDLC
jgi:hypothetical protein